MTVTCVAPARSYRPNHPPTTTPRERRTTMSQMAEQLRRLRDYADRHRVFDLNLLDDAAQHIEALEDENNGLREENAQLNLWIEEDDAA